MYTSQQPMKLYNYYPHFIDGETEAQRSPHIWQVGFKPRSVQPQISTSPYHKV